MLRNVEMTLNHSKTWPVNTFAVVQLRVDSEGHIYSSISKDEEEVERSPSNHKDTPPTENSQPMQYSSEKQPETKDQFTLTPCLAPTTEEPIKQDDNDQTEPQEENKAKIPSKEKASIYPLSKKHLEMFSKITPPPPQYRATVRTDTVSTILDQEIEFDYEGQEEDKSNSKQHDISQVEKFHVLALTRIEESSFENECRIGRRPSIRVDNWDFIYTERLSPEIVAPGRVRCPIHRYGPEPPLRRDSSEPELPLDARKSATLRKHYYLEGGWGWVIVVCSVMVNVVNHGVQLSSATLNEEGVRKFKVEPVHFAGE